MSAPTLSTLPKPFVFVLMPFEAKFNDIYKFGIKGAAEDVGAYAERLDEQLFGEGMLDRIFNQISKADLIVADMTGRNPNVFYEVGYAHALGKVTLLLTQDANDIPFDLKHRQHTVYGGRIETLRKELADRLRWGIEESRRQAKGISSEQLTIRLLGKDIPPAGTKAETPTIGGSTESRSFFIAMQIRNDSPNELSGISHVYLFAEEKAGIVPCEYSALGSLGLMSYGLPSGVNAEPTQIDSFAAVAVDAQDKLTRQFRLPTKFAGMPPGAVETENLHMMFDSGVNTADSLYRLRIHTARQYHEFAFRLKLEHVSPAKPVKKL
jgi:hypothetical protein